MSQDGLLILFNFQLAHIIKLPSFRLEISLNDQSTQNKVKIISDRLDKQINRSIERNKDRSIRSLD